MYKYLIVLLLALLVFVPLFKRDDAGYAKLLKSSEPQKARALCQQFREGVTKKMWTEEEQYCAITSASSELFFFTEKGDVEVIEELENVNCMLQERLFVKHGKKMQTLRLLKAKEASLNYNTQLFTSNNVSMWTYEIAGHAPPDTLEGHEPILEGRADQVELQLAGKSFAILAHHFEGQMR